MTGTIPVNEVFETIQGEATHTGAPAVFVRLQGCPVGCPWCDTKHTWSLDDDARIPVPDMLAKVDPAPTHAPLAPEHLAGLLRTFRARHVVFTGGEPCLYDLQPATAAVQAMGRTAQVETSGTSPVRVAPGTWVTLSPKIGMPGGLSVRPDAVARANEIKMPVGKPADVERLQAFLAQHGNPQVPVWVQPLSRSPKATDLCIQAATEHGWKVSVQVHAFIGVR